MHHLRARNIIGLTLTAAIISTSVHAFAPYVNSLDGKWCMGTPQEYPDRIQINGWPHGVTWSVRQCPDAHFRIGTREQWLRSLSGGWCAVLLERYVGAKQCKAINTTAGDLPGKWELSIANGARLKRKHGFKLGQMGEARCAYPHQNHWILRMCPEDAKDKDGKGPCPKGECLSAWGECGRSTRHCNERSLWNDACPWDHPVLFEGRCVD